MACLRKETGDTAVAHYASPSLHLQVERPPAQQQPCLMEWFCSDIRNTRVTVVEALQISGRLGLLGDWIVLSLLAFQTSTSKWQTPFNLYNSSFSQLAPWKQQDAASNAGNCYREPSFPFRARLSLREQSTASSCSISDALPALLWQPVCALFAARLLALLPDSFAAQVEAILPRQRC